MKCCINECILSRYLTEDLWVTITNTGLYCTPKRQNRDVSIDLTTVRLLHVKQQGTGTCVRISVWLQFTPLTQTWIDYKSLIRQVIFQWNGNEREMYGGWRVSAVATATWKTGHDPDVHAQLSHREMKSVSISMNLDKPSTLTATSQLCLSWRLEFPESGQTRRQPFSCNTITPGPIRVWRPWSTLLNLAGLSYHTHRIIRIWRLLTSICSGRWKMDCVGNIFLATASS